MLTFCNGILSFSRVQDQDLQTSKLLTTAVVKVGSNQLRPPKLLPTSVLLQQYHSTSPNTVNYLGLMLTVFALL